MLLTYHCLEVSRFASKKETVRDRNSYQTVGVKKWFKNRIKLMVLYSSQKKDKFSKTFPCLGKNANTHPGNC